MAYPLQNIRRSTKMNNAAYRWLMEWVLLQEPRDEWLFSQECLHRSPIKIRRAITSSECGAMFARMARENPNYFQVKYANKKRNADGSLPIMEDSKITKGHSNKLYRLRTEEEIMVLEETARNAKK